MVKFFVKRTDGGPETNVTGYWLIEWKAVFSIALLKFSEGSRENFHSHAFNALTWWLKGSVTEVFPNTGETLQWGPSIFPKYTPRSNTHKIVAEQPAWALTFRGPWAKTWTEYNEGQDKTIVLGHGRTVQNG